MAEHTFDRIAVALAGGVSRRRVIAAAIGAFGAMATRRMTGFACTSSAECSAGMVCQQGFCQFPAYIPAGEPCVIDIPCQDGTYCLPESNTCGTRARCTTDPGLACDPVAGCCPGLICSSGICIEEPQAPPENTGGSGGGGGGTETGGGGSSTGGGGGAPSGATSSGVLVSSLPSTGSGSHSSNTWWGAGALAIGTAAGLLGLRQRQSQHRCGDQESPDIATGDRLPQLG
ncbi:hypothetical protein BH23CHL5_BH23CHL5_28030 [soil metagenome]